MRLRKNAKTAFIKNVPLFASCTQTELAAIAAEADELALPIREYALELAESERDEMSRRHLEHFLELAEAADRMGEAGFAHLEREQDNMRAALAWASASGSNDSQLRLAVLLSGFWTRRGHYREGRMWLEDALAAAVEEPTEERMWALTQAAYLAFREGDYTRADVLTKETLAVAHAIDSPKGVVLALNNLGNLASAGRDYGRAASLFAEARDRASASGDERDVALSTSNAAVAAWSLGRLDEAKTLAFELIERARAIGERSLIPPPHRTLGLVALDEGRRTEAADFFVESLRESYELRDRPGIASALDGLAAVAALGGDGTRAAKLASAADQIRSELGVPPTPVTAPLRDHTADLLPTQLSPDDLTAAQREGARMAYDDIITFALEGLSNYQGLSMCQRRHGANHRRRAGNPRSTRDAVTFLPLFRDCIARRQLVPSET
jgi:tetratricopeptide (TPR) repeat protein